MRFLKTAVFGLFSLALLATHANADISRSRLNSFKAHSSHTYVRQTEYRTFRSSTDGRRYEASWVTWQRSNGSRYKRYTWCQLDGSRLCSARNSVVELRGRVAEPEPYRSNKRGEVRLKPLNRSDKYIGQREYRRTRQHESAWVKFARRNGNVYEVYTTCRIGTTTCQNQSVEELGYQRRYDQTHRNGSRRGNYRYNNLTDKQKECIKGAGFLGAIDDNLFEQDGFKAILALCLLLNK